MVRRWVQNKAKLNAAHEKPGPSKKKSKLGCGRKPILSTVEDQLMAKVAHEREQQHHVSTKLITAWAKNLAAEKGLTAFVASRGWLCNFLKRFNLTLRRRTTTGQSTPHDLEDKLYSFVEFNKKQRDLHKFQPSMIANMDETPIWADMPSATTINRRGVQAVPIRTTGHEKNRLTVCLAVKADGTKMTPYVVIPTKKVKKELADISGVIVAATPNGWMNGNLTADWVEKVWTNFSFAKRMLVWDSFKCHISEDMKKQLQRYNTVMSVIPGGCTKYLQPLHVCINKPFKQYFREFYDEWFRKGEFEYTSGGKIKAPSHLKQITWVVQAWGKVSKEVIINSFDVRGITTDNAAKIPCLRKEHGDADTEESTGNLCDIIEDDDNDNNERES
ncbi:unnamed protein product [Clavelina lepadiformis]